MLNILLIQKCFLQIISKITTTFLERAKVLTKHFAEKEQDTLKNANEYVNARSIHYQKNNPKNRK